MVVATAFALYPADSFLNSILRFLPVFTPATDLATPSADLAGMREKSCLVMVFVSEVT